MQRVEGLEPQVTSRQPWPPAVIRASWPGEGTLTPSFVVEILVTWLITHTMDNLLDFA